MKNTGISRIPTVLQDFAERWRAANPMKWNGTWTCVYELVDSRTGKAFYVGVTGGADERFKAHKSDARRGVTCLKSHRIREIWREGGEIEMRKIGLFQVFSDALRHESALIRENCEQLTNGKFA